VHPFPITIRPVGGEAIIPAGVQYDTVVVINVIEHVYNAIEFLSGIHYAVRPGGLLIFQDRYFSDPKSAERILGGPNTPLYHPIRIMKQILDAFLLDFDIIYNNCDGSVTIDGWKKSWRKGETGYYVIARKKMN